MMYPGYCVQVEAWFETDMDDTIYTAYQNLLDDLDMTEDSQGREIDYLETGYDYINFYGKKCAQKFIKSLKKIGVPADQISSYKIEEVKL